MLQHTQEIISKHSPEQLFELISDVEKYPDFLPWCAGARILSKGQDNMLAELIIKFKLFTEKYTSKITLDKPNQITVELVEGPFKKLDNIWKFKKIEEGTIINLTLNCQLKSTLLEGVMSSVFNSSQEKLAEAFLKRADEIYASP